MKRPLLRLLQRLSAWLISEIPRECCVKQKEEEAEEDEAEIHWEKNWKVFWKLRKLSIINLTLITYRPRGKAVCGVGGVACNCRLHSKQQLQPPTPSRGQGVGTVDWMDLTLSAIKITSWLLVWLWLCLLTACHKKVLWCRRQCSERGKREGQRGRENRGRDERLQVPPRCDCFVACLAHSLARFVLELWLYYLDLRLHFSSALPCFVKWKCNVMRSTEDKV